MMNLLHHQRWLGILIGLAALLLAGGLRGPAPAGAQPVPDPARAPLVPNATPSATPTPPCAGQFGVVSSPDPPNVYDSKLAGIAAQSATDIWAVGEWNTFTTNDRPLIEHWDGANWNLIANPAVGLSSELHDVVTLGSAKVWAIGSTIASGTAPRQTLIERWDGTAWTVVPSPNRGSGDNELHALAALGPNNIWAVGQYYEGSTEQPLILHWDGSVWTTVASPNITPYGTFNALTAVAADNIWAVGFAGNTPNPYQTLIEHWDGTSWHVVSCPNPGSGSRAFWGVAAAGPNDIWAVGQYNSLNTSLIEHWDGSAWNVVASPNVGMLNSVMVRAAGDIWATGFSASVLHWDGSAWTQVPSGTFNSDATLQDSVAAGSDLWTVGYYGTAQGTWRALIERYNPTCPTPSATPTPNRTPSATPTRTPPPTQTATPTAPPPATQTPSLTPSATPSPTPNCVSGWNVVASPNVNTQFNTLRDVSGTAADDVWAVGMASLLHWDGRAWSIAQATGELHSVAAIARNDAWTVGYTWTGRYETLIKHWDGQTWTRVPSPNMGTDDNKLVAAVALATDDVWALGLWSGDGTNHVHNLALHWNGTAWSVVPIPDQPNTHNFITRMTARAPDDIWAVGYNDSYNFTTEQMMILHWDGLAWSLSPAPTFASWYTQLHDVAATAPDDAWAVGFSYSQPDLAVNLHWDGSQWTEVAMSDPPSLLQSLAAVSRDDIWADGTELRHWTGSGWLPVFDPPVPPHGLAAMEVISPNDIWAVGSYTNNGRFYSYIEHYTGLCTTPTATPTRTPKPTQTPSRTPSPTPSCQAGWNVVLSPNRGPSDNILNAVAVVAANDVWAVGGSGSVTDETLIEHWDGTLWTLVPAPPVGGLNAVTAFAPNDVWAAGGQILHWNGSTWQQVPNVPTGVFYGLAGRGPNDLWAVGSGSNHTLTVHWNGTAWTPVPSPTTGFSKLSALTVIAPDDVWAVGSVNDQTLTLHWDGATWTTVPSPSPGTTLNDLAAVSATASNDVWAVGRYPPAAFLVNPLVLHWDGTAWNQVIVPVPVPSLGRSLFLGVTALAPDDVWAVGVSQGAMDGMTFIDHWDGTAWTTVPSPNPGANNNIFHAIAGNGADLWAVGFAMNSSNDPTQTMIQHYRSCTTPTPTRTPAPSATPTVCPVQFADVPPGSTFYTVVRCLACRGIISGYPCGGPGEPCPAAYYRPGNNVTRGQTSKIVSAGAQLADPIGSTQQTFQDVPPGSTFWRWIEQLAGRGIVGGYPCGGPGEPCVAPGNKPYFRPNASVTRGQLAKIVAGAAQYTETPTGQTFADVPPGATFYLPVERLAARGIMSGYPCGSPSEPCLAPANRPYFRPGLDATRGQAAKIIANTFLPGCETPTAAIVSHRAKQYNTQQRRD